MRWRAGDNMEFNDGIIDMVSDAIADALMNGAEEIAGQSRGEVPVESGALQGNCRIEAADRMNITVGYNLPYASAVHENLQSNHKTGKAKYLEDPFNAEAESIIEEGAQNIKRVTE
jgi:hypothetical protein